MGDLPFAKCGEEVVGMCALLRESRTAQGEKQTAGENGAPHFRASVGEVKNAGEPATCMRPPTGYYGSGAHRDVKRVTGDTIDNCIARSRRMIFSEKPVNFRDHALDGFPLRLGRPW
jgi:hypothetical protein